MLCSWAFSILPKARGGRSSDSVYDLPAIDICLIALSVRCGVEPRSNESLTSPQPSRFAIVRVLPAVNSVYFLCRGTGLSVEHDIVPFDWADVFQQAERFYWRAGRTDCRSALKS
jgi:hypothetical protein